MHTIHFCGRVFPSVVNISATNLPIMDWTMEGGILAKFTTTITNSEIDVRCDVDRFTEEDMGLAFKYAHTICSAIVNLNLFSKGWGGTVILDTFVNEKGEKTALMLKGDRLGPLCTAYATEKDLDQIIQIVMKEPPLFMAINDLIVSISVPNASSINCARAVEAIKHLIASPGSNDAQAWQQMRDALRLDRSYLQQITDNSTNPRHGRGGYISGAITMEVSRRAWIILNRFLEYRKGGNRQLSEIDFPILKG